MWWNVYAIQQETCISNYLKISPFASLCTMPNPCPRNTAFTASSISVTCRFSSTHPSDEELLVENSVSGGWVFSPDCWIVAWMFWRCHLSNARIYLFMVFLSVLEILGCLAFSLIMTLYTEIPKVYSEAPKIISKNSISISRLGWKKPSRPHMHVGYMLSSPRLWSFPRTWQTFFERCWNTLEYWKWWNHDGKVKVVIFFPWFLKAGFFWDHHFPSRIRSEKHHIDFCKKWNMHKSKFTKSQFQCNKKFSKIFEPLHTYNIDITTPPLIDKIGGLKSSTCTRSSPGPTCPWKKIHTEVRLIRVRYIIYIYIVNISEKNPNRWVLDGFWGVLCMYIYIWYMCV